MKKGGSGGRGGGRRFGRGNFDWVGLAELNRQSSSQGKIYPVRHLFVVVVVVGKETKEIAGIRWGEAGRNTD